MSTKDKDTNQVNNKDFIDRELRKRYINIPVFPLQEAVLFPGLTMPITANCDRDKRLAIQADESGDLIFLVAGQGNVDSNAHLTENDMYKTGVLGKVLNIMPMPDGNINVLVRSYAVGKLTKLTEKDGLYYGNVSRVEEVFPSAEDKDMQVLFSSLYSEYKKLLNLIGEDETADVLHSFEEIDNPVIMMHFIAVNSPLSTEDKVNVLSELIMKERATLLLSLLEQATAFMQIRSDIRERTKVKISQQQREHFLRQQINAIEDELGDSMEDEELNELDAKAEKLVWSEDAKKHYAKEMRKLERFPSNSPEYGIQYNYLENFVNLPWENYSEDNFDLKNVREVLDEDHYGLEKVKERIVEQMAVFKLRGDMKAPILCLYGPPGVGKTSLGKSIARAIGRKYERVALGGVHDEAEIRGHRRTYIGALPGRIIQALEKAGTGNPVFVLDEIDKIAQESKGDPSTALLEVLDPEQNSHFHDNYLNYDYDLSKVMFLATANDLSTISRPLLDRMELIEIPGYVTEEKQLIAQKHLLPKVLREHGLAEDAFAIEPDAMVYIIDRYTHESGVRQLEKQIAKLVRKMAVKLSDGEELPKNVDVALLRTLLGNELEDPDKYEGNELAGIVTGLAWTAAGGEILFVEVSLTKGKGKLTLTGQLGDVMKESAAIALEYLRAHAHLLGLKQELFDSYDIHLHVPQGAIPKDGPSAGITITTAMASAFTRRRVKDRLAMTGEITLRGKVLPVGGIKDKILAAKRAGITNIILSEMNRKDIEEIAPKYVENMRFTYVKHISDVLTAALTDEIDETLPERKALVKTEKKD